MKTLQNLIQILREKQGDDSVVEFAVKRLGIDHSALYRYYSGSREPSLDSIRKIYKAFPNDSKVKQALINYSLGDGDE